MSFRGTLNPTGLLPMERVIRNSAPQDNYSYCRLFKELGLEMTGHGPSLFGNRLVRTRMLGGVGAGGAPPRLPDWNLFSRCKIFDFLPSRLLLFQWNRFVYAEKLLAFTCISFYILDIILD